MADAVLFNQQGNRAPDPKRLVGALAAATIIGDNASAKERIYVGGLKTVAFRFKASSITGTLTANVHPMLSDAGKNDAAGTRGTTGLPTAVTTTNTDEKLIEYTLKGERYVELELSMSNAGSDTCTLSYVDVFGTPV